MRPPTNPPTTIAAMNVQDHMRNSECACLVEPRYPQKVGSWQPPSTKGRRSVAAPRATRFEGLRRAPDPPFKRVDQGRRVSASGVAAPQGFEGGFTGATLAKQTA